LIDSGLRPDFVKLRVNVFLQKDLAGFVGENQISPIFAIPKNVALSSVFRVPSGPQNRRTRVPSQRLGIFYFPVASQAD
jgi:hypothetical protein